MKKRRFKFESKNISHKTVPLIKLKLFRTKILITKLFDFGLVTVLL